MPAPRDENFVPAIQGVSSVDLLTPVTIAVNPSTHALLIDSSSIYPILDTRYVKLNNVTAYNDYVWPNTDGTVDQVLTTDGDGNLSWEDMPDPVAPGGSNTQVQYNNNGAFGGIAGVTWNGTTFSVDVPAIFNDSGADVDYRIESDGDANNFFSDGGTNRIGIGTASPATKLNVVGEMLAEQSGFQVATLSTQITGDTQRRFTADNWGILKWSGGSGSFDTNLYRYLPSTLKTDGALNIGGGLVSFEANGTSVTFAGNQYFNAGNRRFNFSLFTGSDDFFLDGDYTAGGILNIFATNTDDETWYFYRSEAGAKVSVGGGFGAIPSRFTVNDGDIEVVGSANGVILQSPDSTRWRVTVTNAGVLDVNTV